MKPKAEVKNQHKEIKRLENQIAEMKSVLNAIRAGVVDAFVVKKKGNKQRILSLQEAEHPYREIVEAMYEGAVSFIYDGTILYCNKVFSSFVNLSINKVVNTSIYNYIPSEQHNLLKKFIENKKKHTYKNEFLILKRNGKVNVYFSAIKLQINGRKMICVVVTDISELTKRKEIELNNLIDNLKSVNKELQEALNLAQEADKAKSQFLANMSHELRSPLNAIIGFTELMHNEKVGPISEQHKDYLHEVLTSAHHLLQLINQVLDLSRIEAGRIELNPEKISLLQLINEVMDDFKLPIAEKQIQYDLQLDRKINHINLDPVKFKQALYNYISNAIKFTAKKGSITTKVVPEGSDSFRVEVNDTGIGIKDTDLAKLFVPFQQLDSGKSKQYQGSGLGLALTKKLVEAQGGKVGVNSVFGKGSTFYFILPRDSQKEEKFKVI